MPARLTRTLLVAAVLAVGVLVAGAVAGCGDDDGGSGTSAAVTSPPTATGPVASTPAATQPPPQATEPLPPETATTERPPAATAPGETTPREPPADDPQAQEPVRVPATFTAEGGRLTPPQITVPPFLAVELSVASGDGRAHEVVLATPRLQRFDVPAGSRGTVRVPGLRAGEYTLELDGRAAGTLFVGGEAGP